MSRSFRACLLLYAFVLLFPLAASAATGDYDVAAYNNSTLGESTIGTAGTNYVMLSPDVVNLHVSSVYVWQHPDGYNAAEVGWASDDDDASGAPRFFAVWNIDGGYHEEEYNYPTPGTNHYYGVRYDATLGNGEWVWTIDGVQKHRGGMGDFTKGYSLASSERNDNIGDTNYSHFWNLNSRTSSDTWTVWTNMAQYRDWDGGYHYHETSNTEFTVHTPNTP